jgi:hypothetical protein
MVEKSGVNVLKKLSRRRKMFEDYIKLINKPGGVKGRLRLETWEVGRELRRET